MSFRFTSSRLFHSATRRFTSQQPLYRHVARRVGVGLAVIALPAFAIYQNSRHDSMRPVWGMNAVNCAAAVSSSSAAPNLSPVKPGDYATLRQTIASILEDPSFDDGSLGPLFVRLAWHASGTYSVFDKSGGSNGGTMRFPPESSDGANAGLDIARQRLEAVKRVAPWCSYGDLWTLAGVVAIEEMGGPTISWTPGRVDIRSERDTSSAVRVPPNGRLPDADKGGDHIRAVFYRMGFSDREIVALVGAHSLGRCHANRSGFEGPWTRSPTTFSNEFFRVLLEEKWEPVTLSNGVKQFMNKQRDLMMLPADLALAQDKNFRPFVELYAKNDEVFSRDFAAAFSKLLHLGVPSAK